MYFLPKHSYFVYFALTCNTLCPLYLTFLGHQRKINLAPVSGKPESRLLLVGIYLLLLTNMNTKAVLNISEVKRCLVYQCYKIIMAEGYIKLK